jgi:citrate lyase beta subunit
MTASGSGAAWSDIGAQLDRRLAGVDAELAARRRPGSGRQPVHTAYVPADQVTAGVAATWGAAALELVDRHGDPDVLGVDEPTYRRLLTKLEHEPVEDLRVDFEDGYRAESEGSEDATARQVAPLLTELGARHYGVRIRSLEAGTRPRAVRTLELLLGSGAAPVHDSFVITLPKVTSPDQVTALHEICDALQGAYGLAPLQYEIQVETPEAVARIASIVAATDHRCTGLHYGTYDYSAALGVAAMHQALDHPVADHAKDVMQVVAAVAGLRVVDGSTNIVPAGTTEQVRAAWDLHRRLVARSLRRGIYQGWDMHPGHLVSRYAAVLSFYRTGFAESVRRLRDYLQRRSGSVLDEPATARALAAYLVRGLDCGALDEDEVVDAAGVDRNGLAALASR